MARRKYGRRRGRGKRKPSITQAASLVWLGIRCGVEPYTEAGGFNKLMARKVLANATGLRTGELGSGFDIPLAIGTWTPVVALNIGVPLGMKVIRAFGVGNPLKGMPFRA